MAVKSYKIKMIKPVGQDEGDWKGVGQILNDIDYYIMRVKNRASSNAYLNTMKHLEYEQQHGKKTYVNHFKETHGVGFSAWNARQVKSEFEQIDRYALETFNAAIREAEQVVSTKMGDILKGNAVIPTFKHNQPMPVRNRGILVTKEGNDFYASFALIGGQYAKEIGRNGREKTRIKFMLSSKGQEKILLDRLTNGTYRLCDSHIRRKNGTWYFMVSYEMPDGEKADLIPNRVLGIDMGISKAVYMAVSDSPVSDYIDGGEIEKFRNTVEARRKKMRHQLHVASNNRRGHGRKTLMSPLEVLDTKVSDFRKLTNHRYAKYIVDFAVKNQCAIIQMEDLTGISKDDAFMKRWSYFDLQTQIKTKAKEQGIAVNVVKPGYTSQRCYNCGVIRKENRVSQAVYQCTCEKRGKTYRTNADLNAARNLSVLGIESVIAEQLESQHRFEQKASI